LREKSAGGITVDMCYGGCGGIWFDAAELERVSGPAAATLHSIWQGRDREAGSDGPRACPRCPDQVLMRKWFSDERKVEIDQCAQCGGLWLDDGEFTDIHEEMKRNQGGSVPWATAMADAVIFVRTHLRAADEPPRA